MKRPKKVLAITGAILVCFFLVDLLWGISVIKLASLDLENPQFLTFLHFRVPRTFTALATGAALSIAGLYMQSLFRNPLAGPYILGIGSGSQLVISIALLALPASVFMGVIGQMQLAIFSFLGALLILGILALLSLRFRESNSLLLIGIICTMFVSAAVSILEYFSSSDALKSLIVWSLGSFQNVSLQVLPLFLGLLFVGIFAAGKLCRSMDACYLSTFEMQTIGVSPTRLRWSVFIVVALLAGTTTAFCGPIAFLGIAIPFIMRKLLQTSKHSLLFYACLLGGGTAALSIDILSTHTFSNITLPINAISSLLGAPLFIAILWRKHSALW